MKMKITLPSDLEVENVKFDNRTRTLELDLIYYGRGAEATAGVIQTINERGLTKSISVMRVSGKTGKLQIQDRSARVVPPIDKEKQAQTPAVEAAPAEPA